MFHHLLARSLVWACVLNGVVPLMGQVRSVWLDPPPTLDGNLDPAWKALLTRETIASFGGGRAYFGNDATHLYCFVEAVADTIDDAGDSLSIVVDMSRDGKLSPHDISFQIGSQAGQSSVSVFAGVQGWMRIAQFQDSQRSTAFGSGRASYRHWEVALPLARMRFRPGDAVNLAVRVSTGRPRAEFWLPQDQSGGVTSLLKVDLAPSPAPSPTTPVDPPLKMTPQGLKRTHPDGSYEIILPHGIRRFDTNGNPVGPPVEYYTVDVIPPDAPSASQEQWLKAKAEALLAVIRKLVGGDEASVNLYLSAYEPNNPSTYLRVHTRIWMIQQLVGVGG